jgi:hypothetical protein
MFMKSYLFVLIFSALFANAAVLVERKQTKAVTRLQMNKLKESGLLDNFDKDNLDKELKGMDPLALIGKIADSPKFKEVKTASDKNNKAKNPSYKASNDKVYQLKQSGLLNKLKPLAGKTTKDKVKKLSAKTVLIKIAQSQKFKEVYFKKKEAERKAKKPKIVTVIQKNKSKVPTATIVSIKGGPAITLHPNGHKTTFAGKLYTATSAPLPKATGGKNSAGSIVPPSLAVSAVLFAKLVAVVGGAFGGALLVL